MTTKINLDELERIARAATPGPWLVSDHPEFVITSVHQLVGDTYGSVNDLKNAAHIAANDPDTTIALITRIRASDEAREGRRHRRVTGAAASDLKVRITETGDGSQANSDVAVRVNLSQEMIDAISSMASKRGVTMSHVIRCAIGTEKFLDEVNGDGGSVFVEYQDGRVRQLVPR